MHNTHTHTHTHTHMHTHTQAYKRKFVILRNNSALKCKTVDILDTETVDENADIIPLGEVWTVQDKSSKTKGRYPFEVGGANQSRDLVVSGLVVSERVAHCCRVDFSSI